MKRLLLIVLLLFPLCLKAQDVPDIPDISDAPSIPVPSIPLTDTVYVLRTDTVRLYRTDTLRIYHTDTIIRREADTAALKALQEKEVFYREILNANGVDKEKLEAERNYYIRVVDSLRALVRIAELENVRKQEENKYLAERAKAAEERIALATSRKKKVRPIQGIAM